MRYYDQNSPNGMPVDNGPLDNEIDLPAVPAALLEIAAHQMRNLNLTDAEFETAILAVQGLSNQEIAERLEREESTIRWRLLRVYDRLGCRDKTQLAARVFGFILGDQDIDVPDASRVVPRPYTTDERPRLLRFSVDATLLTDGEERVADATMAIFVHSIGALSRGNGQFKFEVIPGETSLPVTEQELMKLRRDRAAEEYGLSSREREVLEGIVEGCSNSEIAQKLFIAECTIKTYVSSILEKSNCENRVQLVSRMHGII
jgi:DNA-binding NarL/FixJ family response regulator